MLDLAGVSFCDSAGLDVLLGAPRQADAIGAMLVLARVPEPVRGVLELTGADQVLRVFDTAADAEALQRLSRCGGLVVGGEVDETAQGEVGFRGMRQGLVEVEGVPVVPADAAEPAEGVPVAAAGQTPAPRCRRSRHRPRGLELSGGDGKRSRWNRTAATRPGQLPGHDVIVVRLQRMRKVLHGRPVPEVGDGQVVFRAPSTGHGQAVGSPLRVQGVVDRGRCGRQGIHEPANGKRDDGDAIENMSGPIVVRPSRSTTGGGSADSGRPGLVAEGHEDAQLSPAVSLSTSACRGHRGPLSRSGLSDQWVVGWPALISLRRVCGRVIAERH
ncbi:STAS domain-containing protein [Streptomyces sp. NPDC020489]|uniref:STAS domain-containing protein n=1 Tax=Streptomyces sp. NPDC020489 TaxID=3365077 RepID=UPI0037B636E0